jgi:hypothetical protein
VRLVYSPKILDGFEVGDVVTCATDRHPKKWKILYLRISQFAGRELHLADLSCVEIASSGSTYQNRVGMARSNVGLNHLTKVAVS